MPLGAGKSLPRTISDSRLCRNCAHLQAQIQLLDKARYNNLIVLEQRQTSHQLCGLKCAFPSSSGVFLLILKDIVGSWSLSLPTVSAPYMLPDLYGVLTGLGANSPDGCMLICVAYSGGVDKLGGPAS